MLITSECGEECVWVVLPTHSIEKCIWNVLPTHSIDSLVDNKKLIIIAITHHFFI